MCNPLLTTKGLKNTLNVVDVILSSFMELVERTLKNMGYEHVETRPAFLTTDEVLDYLKVTSRTIYRLIKAGDLPAVRIGRQWRFRQSDLDAWLDRQQANTN
jgi:excisionase family DNA binding protein